MILTGGGGRAGEVFWLCWDFWDPPGLSVRGKKKTFATPTETNIHGDALCFMVIHGHSWSWGSSTQRLAVGGW